MSRKTRTETFIETRQVVVIRRRPGKLVRGACLECAGLARLVTPEEAAALVSVNPRTIYRWVETDRIHFRELPQGLLLICVNSLFNRMQV